MGQQTGVRSGLLLMVIGLFVLLRTVTKDSSGRTLVNHLGVYGDGGSGSGGGGGGLVSSIPGAVAKTEASGVTHLVKGIKHPTASVPNAVHAGEGTFPLTPAGILARLVQGDVSRLINGVPAHTKGGVPGRGILPRGRL